jgi:hypothetical protein
LTITNLQHRISNQSSFFFNRFPFDSNSSPAYEIIYFFNIYTGFVAMSAICASDGLFYGLCSHISAQFDIISLRLNRLMEKEIGRITKIP